MSYPPSLWRVCYAAALLFLFSQSIVSGQEEQTDFTQPVVQDVEELAEETATAEADERVEIYQPRKTAPDKETIIGEHAITPQTSSWLTRIGSWLFALAVFALCIVYLKKKGFFGGLGNAYGQKQLEVLETTALGSKQFLVLARARNKEMILGVGPGFITNLDTVEVNESELPSADALNEEFAPVSDKGGNVHG